MAATLGARLPVLAAAAPGRAALICDGEVVTRAYLTAGIAARAAHLAACTPPGAGIALAMGNGPELVEAFFACAVSGRQALVYDPAWPAPYRTAIDAALAPALTLDGPMPGAVADVSSAPFPPPPAPEAQFYIGFTSGSTGLPKGYRRCHRSWIDSFKVSEAAFCLNEDDVVLAPGGLAASLHLYGVVHALHSGATPVMMRQFHPRRALSLIARHGVTALYATPTQLQMLVDAGAGARFPSLRVLMISGAKWRAETRAAVEALFPRAGIAEFYGASETSFITLSRPDEAVPPGSVGRAAPGVRLRIRDASGRDLAAGEAGVIWVASTMLFDGYACGEAPETRREGDFLTIGDHGRLDEAGYLYLHGREKRMLVTSGLNVYPEEVETVLASLPGIEEAAVFGLPDLLRGVELVAVLRGAFDESALRGACRALLPAAKIPRRFLALEEWPRTSGGKADLRALEAFAAERLKR